MTAQEQIIYPPANIPPARDETITGLFLKRVACTPHAIAYRYYNPSESCWIDKTWEQTLFEVARWQSAFKNEGLQKGDRIAVMGHNSWHWVVADQAALGLGLVVVPLYVNDLADDAYYVIRNSGARLLILDGPDQWQLLQHKLLDDVQVLKIISLGPVDHERVTTSTDWLPDSSNPVMDDEVCSDDLASIVYTSGTTGIPKGVMLSHGNIVSNVSSCMRAVPINMDDIFLSFLPLSHMLERTVGYYLPILGGSTVAFTRGIPLLAEDIKIIRPTRIISVPRIYERIYARLNERIQAKPGFIQRTFNQAVTIGWEYFEYQQGRSSWSSRFLKLPALNQVFARKLQKQLGGRLKSAICGGAPLSPKIARTFIALGIPLLQGYGLTEASPVVSVNRLHSNIPESIGLPLADLQVRIGEHGELLVRGDSVMQGYWCDRVGTTRAIDPDGWLHTGDIAEIHHGFIYITGRLKEIIVLSTGEKVSPGDLEMAISGDPLIEQALVIGEGYPYLTALVVLNENRIDRALKEDHAGLETRLLERIAQRLHQFPSYEQIKHVHYTFDPWSVENELLTPTFKMKRKNIMKKYADQIAHLYEGHVVYQE